MKERYKLADSLFQNEKYGLALKEYLIIVYLDPLKNKQPFLDGKIVSCYIKSVLATKRPNYTKELYPDIPDSLIKGIPWFPRDYDPKLITKIDPVHPEKSNYEEIIVYLDVWVDTLGSVRVTKVVKGADESFNEAAINAVLQWKFSPALFQKQKIGCWKTIPVKFRSQK